MDSRNSSPENGPTTEAYVPEATRTVTPRQALALVATDDITSTVGVANLLRRRFKVLGALPL